MNCHSPRAASPPLLCGCWQVVVLSYQGRREGFGVELNEGGGSEGAHRLPNLTKLVVHGGFCQPGKWMKVTKEKLYEQ